MLKRLVVFGICSLVMLSVNSAHAVARSGFTGVSVDCDAAIQDGAGVFKDGASVRSAVQELQSHGAEVRVISLNSIGHHGSLDKLKGRYQQLCASWKSADGGMKNNLIVLMFSMEEKKLGLYYGDQWSSSLSNTWPGILSKKVGPKFRDGDFAGGVAAGLLAVSATIAPPPAPTGGSSSGTSKVWWILGGVLGAGLVLLVIVLLVRSSRRKERLEAERRATQQAAKQGKVACQTRVTELYGMVEEMENEVTQFESLVSKSDCDHLRAICKDAKREFEEALARHEENSIGAGNPSDDSLSTVEYRQIESAFGKVLKELDDARKGRDRFNEAVKNLMALIDGAEGELNNLAAMLVETQRAIETIASRGFFVQAATAKLEEAEEEYRKADAAFAEKKYFEGNKCYEKALAADEEAASAATAVVTAHRELTAEHSELERRVQQAERSLRESREVFVLISSKYAPSSWESIRGNEAEAEKAHAEAGKKLGEMRDRISMESQEWKRAEMLAATVEGLLQRIHKLIGSIGTMHTKLKEAEEHARPEIMAAEADIEKARNYITRHDADIRESLEDDLAGAMRSVGEANSELSRSRPDYLMVVKLAKQANSAADRILKEARDEVEAAERLRRKAATSVREAERSILTAQNYVNLHMFAVDLDMRRQLSEASHWLTRALTESDMRARIRCADRADELADDVLDRAQASVRHAEELERAQRERDRREAEREARNWRDLQSDIASRYDDEVALPAPSGDQDESLSQGGGGSVSWGDSSDGSGGSSGW